MWAAFFLWCARQGAPDLEVQVLYRPDRGNVSRKSIVREIRTLRSVGEGGE
ncbi:hypothetical protein SBDP1_880021 [Syntrophobacter sp. SbD1]|nr:hypothetical protein SBDP1_880021 [Syntrophobacter sp. SbD1]